MSTEIYKQIRVSVSYEFDINEIFKTSKEYNRKQVRKRIHFNYDL
jgi:hypothetical protein